MSELSDNPVENFTLEYPLDYQRQETLNKLAAWSKFVGIANIILGILNFLTIFFMSIPTVIIGVIMILIGTRLNSAAANLRYSVFYKESQGLVNAIEQLRSYMLLNGIMFIIILVMIFMTILIILFFGGAVKDLFWDASQIYTMVSRFTMIPFGFL